MQRQRVTATISFKNAKKKEAAHRKAQQRGRTLSSQVQHYFDNLPDLDSSH
jgi:hypothetical protein